MSTYVGYNSYCCNHIIGLPPKSQGRRIPNLSRDDTDAFRSAAPSKLRIGRSWPAEHYGPNRIVCSAKLSEAPSANAA